MYVYTGAKGQDKINLVTKMKNTPPLTSAVQLLPSKHQSDQVLGFIEPLCAKTHSLHTESRIQNTTLSHTAQFGALSPRAVVISPWYPAGQAVTWPCRQTGSCYTFASYRPILQRWVKNSAVPLQRPLWTVQNSLESTH